MSSETNKPKINYRYLFKDIINGYSEVEHSGKKFFVKHLSALDQVDLEVLEEKFFDAAKKRGVPTKEEALERLKEELLWSEEDESKIKEQKDFIDGIQKSRKQLFLKSDIDLNKKQLEEAQVKLFELEYKKEELIGQTSEKYAKSRVNDHYILASFYIDKDLSKEAFSEDLVDDMSASELQKVIAVYNEKLSLFTDLHIQELTLQDFYSPCYPFSDNVMNFFNKPLFQLSTNQVKLIIFTRMFKNIFENYQDIPEQIQKDPEKIIDYVNAKESSKQATDNLDKEGASTLVGAKKEDYEYLGYKTSPQGKSLSSMLKDKGGRMNMEDLIETMT